MRLTVLLVLLTVCWQAVAQPIADKRRMFMFAGPTKAPNPTPCISSFTDPSQIAGLAFRWVHTDLANNAGVQDWVDRVSSNHLVQATSGNRPTNSSSGVRFDDSKWLVSTNVTITTNTTSFYMICNMDKNSGHDYWIFNLGTRSGQALHEVSSSVDTLTWGIGGGNSEIPAALFDVVESQSVAQTKVYTNGVLRTTSTTGIGTFTIVDVGEPGSDTLGSTHGYIKEIGIYTNTTLTADAVCSIHYYATNTYGYTP